MRFLLRLLSISSFLFIVTSVAFAQSVPNGELGLQLGGTYYLGEINKVPFRGTKPSVAAFYRHSFNARYSAKGTLLYCKLGASDSTYSSAYQKARGFSFSRPLCQLSLLGEFNFLPFIVGKQKMPYTTYIQGGFGLAFLPDKSKMEKILFDIPFGLGAKFNTTGRFVYGFDIMMIKTFSDNIDFVSSNSSENNMMKQKYLSSNKDWLSYFAIYLAYRIEYPQKCPSFD